MPEVAPGGGRTHSLWLRRPTLYPVELRARSQRLYSLDRHPTTLAPLNNHARLLILITITSSSTSTNSICKFVRSKLKCHPPHGRQHIYESGHRCHRGTRTKH